MTVLEWATAKRYSPADAYRNLLFMARRKEVVMHPELRGLWRDKWRRRVHTQFTLKGDKS